MAIHEIKPENASSPIGPYSKGIEVNGDVWTSGQLGTTPDGQVAAYFEDECRLALLNGIAVVEAGGRTLRDVVKTTVYLVQPEPNTWKEFKRRLDIFNHVYEEVFEAPPWPARSLVQVGRIPREDGRVEVEMTAVDHGS